MDNVQLILDIAFVLVALIFIAIGAKRGLIKSLIHSAKLILAFVFAHFLGGTVGAFLKDRFIFGSVYDFVYKYVNDIYRNAAGNVPVEQIMEKLPEFAKTEELQKVLADATAQESGTALIETVATNVSNPIADVISNALGYACVFVGALLLLWVAAFFLTKIADKIAFIGTANHILGGVWGALTAAVLLLIAASAIKLFLGDTDIYANTVVVKFFGDSALLEVIKIFDVGSAWFTKA